MTLPIAAHPACSETKQQQQARALNLNKSIGAPAVMRPSEHRELPAGFQAAPLAHAAAVAAAVAAAAAPSMSVSLRSGRWERFGPDVLRDEILN